MFDAQVAQEHEIWDSSHGTRYVLMEYLRMCEWDLSADITGDQSTLKLMAMNASQEWYVVGELERVKMTIVDLKNWLGVAETAVGNERKLVKRLCEKEEVENNMF